MGYDFEEIKEKALADFKERNKRLEDWFMSLRGRHGNGKGFIEQIK